MSAIVSSDTPTPQVLTSTSAAMRNEGVMFGNENVVKIKSELNGDHDLNTIDIEPAIIKEELIEDASAFDNTTTLTDRNSREQSNNSPKIRLTPTFKLMPTPNPVDPKRKFVCPYENCTKSYGKSSHLRSHLTWHTGIKPFVCREPNCGKGFTRSDELNRHVRTHTGEKPFECVQCFKKFSRSDHLTKHLATHAKQMQITPNKRPRSNPVSTTDEQKEYDGLHFMAALLETTPIIRQEPEPENLTDEPPLDHTPIKIKLEKPENSEHYHVVQEENDPLSSQYDTSREFGGDNNRRSNGNASFTTGSSRYQEENRFDSMDDEIMPEANGPPLDISNNHNGIEYDPQRPFGCRECLKSFKRQDDLTRHTRTHTGEKPFSCCECERRFMRSDHLKKHMKTHTKSL